MEVIRTFLVEHLDLIISCVIGLGVLILQFIKKRPTAKSVIDYAEEIFAQYGAPAILAAEKSGLKGSDKLAYALQILKDKLGQVVKLDDDMIAKIGAYFMIKVEEVLETPRKK